VQQQQQMMMMRLAGAVCPAPVGGGALDLAHDGGGRHGGLEHEGEQGHGHGGDQAQLNAQEAHLGRQREVQVSTPACSTDAAAGGCKH
jgi:hypothetical protein